MQTDHKVQVSDTRKIIVLISFRDIKSHVQVYVILTYMVTLEGYNVAVCLFEIPGPSYLQMKKRASLSLHWN